ncbi:MAG: response regulator [Planctomycetes bacterium]|nr:response regulator [Planctomycetota bacterium]
MASSKILIIDDDQDLTSALQTVLESNQYSVSTAASPDEGMEKLNAEKPDLIILDVMMTTWQDGFDMARSLKKDDEFKAIPILMLTGVEDKTGLEFKSEAGDEEWLPVEVFLDKPVDPETFLAEVKKLLS